jgi:hypothetical protein
MTNGVLFTRDIIWEKIENIKSVNRGRKSKEDVLLFLEIRQEVISGGVKT